MKHEAIGVT